MRTGPPTWRELADATPVALVVLDGRARVVHANSAMVGLTGRPAAELLGTDASSLVSLRLDVPGAGAATVAQHLAPGEVVEVPVRPQRSAVVEPEGWSVLALLDLRREAALEARATTDHLTGLPDRAGLAALVGPVVAGAATEGRLVALAFLDVDGLKAVNDRLGHEAGDALLLGVATGIHHALAGQPGAVGARIGGDEFVVLATVDDEAAAAQLVARLRAAVGDPTLGPSPAVSIGLAVAPAAGFDMRASLAEADAAMYVEKRRSGRRATAAVGGAGDRSPTERRSRPGRDGRA